MPGHGGPPSQCLVTTAEPVHHHSSGGSVPSLGMTHEGEPTHFAFFHRDMCGTGVCCVSTSPFWKGSVGMGAQRVGNRGGGGYGVWSFLIDQNTHLSLRCVLTVEVLRPRTRFALGPPPGRGGGAPPGPTHAAASAPPRGLRGPRRPAAPRPRPRPRPLRRPRPGPLGPLPPAGPHPAPRTRPPLPRCM